MQKPTKAKLLIGSTGKSIEVMFNPTDYTITRSSNYSKETAPSTSNAGTTPASAPSYTGDNSSTLEVQLFFDTSREGTDVRKSTYEIVKLQDEKDSKTKVPLDVTFVWGSLKFKGYIQNITQKYTMFNSAGLPVRATLDISIISSQSAKDQYSASFEVMNIKISRFLLRAGMQLCMIAAQELASSVKWRSIAKKNNIDNPAKLDAGKTIDIPRS